jgi:hypothetical protein
MPYSNIDKPASYFNTVLYAGNDTGQSITTGFANDFVWIKDRGGTDSHTLFDVIRTPLKRVLTNLTDAESTLAGSLTAFNSNGFTLGNSDNVNDIGHNFVSWNWLAGGTGVSNTVGSRTSTVSANTTSGFSIVSYTGNSTAGTVGHGLGVAPKMMIIKDRSSGVYNWTVYHSSIGNTRRIILNSDAGQDSANSVWWNNTSPTSTVFTIGSDNGANASGDSFIAYCFAEVKGYSKFASYTGNGNADGTFIYTGFKPSMVIRKRTDSAQDWLIQDNRRTGINQTTSYTSILKPNSNGAELGFNEIDILSNGFKCRASDTHGNASGGNYIYMAFADNPFVSSKGIPTTAR